MRHKLKKLALISSFAIALSGCGMTEKTVYVAYLPPPLDMQSESETAPDASYVEYDGNLKIEDGCLLPMLNYSDFRDPGYSNEYSDILRFCVYVETDHDTDNDGMATLSKHLCNFQRGQLLGISRLQPFMIRHRTHRELLIRMNGTYIILKKNSITKIFTGREKREKLSTSTPGEDGFMITAVLIDTADDAEPFDAYMTKAIIQDCVTDKTIKELDIGGGAGLLQIRELVKSPTYGKCITFGWTDLFNPGCGPVSSEFSLMKAMNLICL